MKAAGERGDGVTDTVAAPTAQDPEIAARLMMDDPATYFHASEREMHSIPREQHDAMLLAGVRRRFAELRDRVPILTKLADEQRVEEIAEIDDVVPLLFSHTMYKSYPLSLLDNCQFTLLTKWLNKLTSIDLSGVDVTQCQGIDDWVRTLDEQTAVRIRHSSSTSGHMSFIPRTEAEGLKHFYSMIIGTFDPVGLPVPTPGHPLGMHLVVPMFASGNTAHARTNEYLARAVAGNDPSKLHFLYPGRQSSDMMFLAGRLRAAQALGEADRLELGPALVARRAEFEAMAKEQEASVEAFFSVVIDRLRGQRIYATATWNVFYNLAQAGLARGIRGVLDPRSVIMTGGGAKGQVVPPGWEEQVTAFLGVPRLNHGYGMTEVMASHKMCSEQRFHIEPWSVLFVLDPDTGDPLPRCGTQTGRAAFFDLLAETYWGGFVSGDEVTVEWTEQCACGRTTPHMARTVERYSAQRGGDDKISCAAAADAHDAALNFLTDSLA